MNEKKQKTENSDQWASWEQDTYQTGSTCPPKRHSGAVAFLLGLVIFLCGIITALSLMNIHLFRQLREQLPEATSPVAFAHSDISDAPPAPEAEEVRFPLGFTGQDVPEFWNLYQDMPLGIYITEVSADGPAEQVGILPGDILLKVNDVRITDTASLSALLESCDRGNPVNITLYRNDAELPVQVNFE